MTDEEVVTEDPGPLCGERLREARRELQISVAEISKELHLDEGKVRALEKNEFSELGAPVFAKGHLRKYAQLVKLDESDVIAEFEELATSEGPPPVVSDRKRPVIPSSSGQGVLFPALVIVIILIAAVLVWYFGLRTTPTTTATTPEASTSGLVQDSTPLARPQPSAVEEAAEAQPAVADEQPEVTAEVVEPRAPAEEAGDLLNVVLEFSGDCWTEITDADGERLFFDLGRDGRRVELNGRPPVSVLFGNANNVSLEVDGAAFNIGADDRRGDTARLTLYKN